MLGAWRIALDPIFSGLAWSVVFDSPPPTATMLVVIPVSRFALLRERMPAAAHEEKPC